MRLKTTLPDTFTDLLAARGLTQQQLATAARLSISTVERLCIGGFRAQRATIRKLAAALSVTVDQVQRALEEQLTVRDESIAVRSLRLAVTNLRLMPMSGLKAMKGRQKLLRILNKLSAEVTKMAAAVEATIPAKASPPDAASSTKKRLILPRPKAK